VVMECDLQKRAIGVYDGYVKYTTIDIFAPQVKHILARCGLIHLRSKEHFVQSETDSRLLLSGASSGWSLEDPIRYVRQYDGHSCGPIACLKSCLFLEDIRKILRSRCIIFPGNPAHHRHRLQRTDEGKMTVFSLHIRKGYWTEYWQRNKKKERTTIWQQV
jgi:hypothetical protein